MFAERVGSLEGQASLAVLINAVSHPNMDSEAISELFSITDVEEARLDYFKDYIWYNSEVCNHCMEKVRDIGPEIARSAESQTYYINAWYERTEAGSQEYAPGDENKRYGQCYCLGCGRDTSANHRNIDLRSLGSIATNLYKYITFHTPIDIDHERFSKEIVRLKKDPIHTGNETEILAVAFARSVVSAPEAQDQGGSENQGTTDGQTQRFTSTEHGTQQTKATGD